MMRQVLSHAQTHKGLVRKLNEDACLDLADSGVWLVADGMGGHAAGDIASQLVVDTVRVAVQRGQQVSLQLITDALQQANQELCHYSELHLQGHTAGSTVVALIVLLVLAPVGALLVGAGLSVEGDGAETGVWLARRAILSAK